MAKTICLLRGINVGGKAPIKMAELKALLEKLGYADVHTVLQSGNAVFSGKGDAKKIGDAIERAFGVRPAVILRTAAQLRKAADDNPFKAEAKRDPGHLAIAFLDGKPGKDAKAGIEARIAENEKYKLGGAEIHLYCGNGMGRSKLATSLERTIGTSATIRNWNTIEKLLALAEDD